MLCLTRRVVAGSFLALAMLAGPAAAECAWVLWGRVVDDPIMSPKGWFIRGSFDRRVECAKAYAVYLGDMRRLGWDVIGDQDTATGQGALITAPPSMVSLAKYRENVVCRPDSVPPTQGGVLGS